MLYGKIKYGVSKESHYLNSFNSKIKPVHLLFDNRNVNFGSPAIFPSRNILEKYQQKKLRPVAFRPPITRDLALSCKQKNVTYFCMQKSCKFRQLCLSQ